MRMVTPLSRVLGLGAAGTGTEAFWRQRVTSVAAIPLTLFLIFASLYLAGSDHDSAAAFLAHPLVAVTLALTIVVYAVHMRLGMEEIIVDYVHAPGPKFVSIVLNTFYAVAVAAVCLFALLSIAFGN